ncbi:MULTISPECIES: hydrogenase maturation protease [Metabacillus]|uniref:Hydrogenase maturation protease n=2 Tax=Metabacillus TaxID=2675233 RepID=A0A179SW62_9BACI|nr:MULTISPECIES: hydrogenase maturation protease [Metabacillus]OAS85614.1 hydrogenase maturation protease [Metabacillus litoralis]QNF27987.1 hydrogenase maturation protease [Metabacillus sp. KUDC1714]
MENIIVLGIGNILMMDDGIGIDLIEQLSKLNRTPHVSFLIGESDIDYCMDQIMNATFVIIVDAVFSGNEPGELTVYPLANLHEYQTLDISAHNFHLFQSLYQQKESIKGYLIGVEPYEIRFHIGLSKTLREKWKTILQDVSQTIDSLIAKN